MRTFLNAAATFVVVGLLCIGLYGLFFGELDTFSAPDCSRDTIMTIHAPTYGNSVESLVNKIARRELVDPYALAALIWTNTAFKWRGTVSATGAYGPASLYPSEIAKLGPSFPPFKGAPSSCFWKHPRKGEAGYVFDPDTAQGYCRTKPSMAQETDPTCGTPAIGHAVFEQSARDCARWMERHPEAMLRGAIRLMRHKTPRHRHGDLARMIHRWLESDAYPAAWGLFLRRYEKLCTDDGGMYTPPEPPKSDRPSLLPTQPI